MIDVTFGEPSRLFALWGILPLAALLVYGRARRERGAAAFLDAPMRARLQPTRRGVRGAAPAVLFVVGLALLVVALARPRFGTVYEKVSQRGADLVVVLDVSRSMLSRDVHPSRLERSKAYIRDLLERVAGHRVGLVAFAGRPVVACPMTADLAFFESVLDEVSPDSAPRGGTVIGDALRSAVDVLDPVPDRDQAFLLITDGEDQDSFPLEAAAAAAERGVRIFTVGIGDPSEGARIPVDGDGAAARYLQYEGKDVVSRMDEQLLQDIARETRGAYVPARTGTYDLGDVYVDHLAALRAGALREEERKRFKEQYQLFAGLGLLALLASMLVRPTTRRATWALAGALAVTVGTAGPARADESTVESTVEGVETLNRAVEALEQGEVDAAVGLLDEASKLLPDEPLVKFDRGVAEQARGALDVAETSYAAAARSGDARATAWARYNLGTVEVEHAKEAFGGPAEDAVGDAREGGTASIERAIAEFRAALRVDPTFEEARYNLELLRVWLKHIRDVWARRDAEREEQEQADQPPDPVKLLEGLLDDQQRLKDETREQPAGRAAVASRQQELAPRVDEVRGLVEGVLEQSVGQARQALEAQGQLGPNGELPPEFEEQLRAAREQLLGPVEDVATAVDVATEALAADDGAGALIAQGAVLDGLARAWSALADVPKLLDRMIAVEDEVVARTDVHLAAPEEASLPAVGTLERQERVGGAAVRLGALAQAMVQQIEQSLAAPIPDELEEEQRAQAEQQRAQAEALRPMLEKAVENAPLIPPLAEQVAAHLEFDEFPDARVDEEEIRRLLQEIRELAPPEEEQDPQQQQQPSDSDDENQENQDEQEGQDPPQDQENPDEPQEPKDPNDPNESSDPAGEPPEQEPGEPRKLSPQQVRELLQKALDREQELKEKEKALERLLAVPVPVEKDW